MTESKHTLGTLFVNWSGHPDNGRIQICSAKDYICEMYHKPDDEADEAENLEQTKANAARIVQCWNEYDELVSDRERLKTLNRELAGALALCLSYLADLNGSEWITGDGAGELDMKQRANGLQKLAYETIAKYNSTNH